MINPVTSFAISSPWFVRANFLNLMPISELSTILVQVAVRNIRQAKTAATIRNTLGPFFISILFFTMYKYK